MASGSLDHHPPLTKTVRFAEPIVATLEYIPPFGSEDQHMTLLELDCVRSDIVASVNEWKTLGIDIIFNAIARNPVQEQINAFHQLPELLCARGAERYVSRLFAKARKKCKSRVRRSVLLHQEILKQQEIPSDQVWEELAIVSRNFSVGSRDFALQLGEADKYAVQHGDTGRPAMAFLRKLKAEMEQERSSCLSGNDDGHQHHHASNSATVLGQPAKSACESPTFSSDEKEGKPSSEFPLEEPSEECSAVVCESPVVSDENANNNNNSPLLEDPSESCSTVVVCKASLLSEDDSAKNQVCFEYPSKLDYNVLCESSTPGTSFPQ